MKAAIQTKYGPPDVLEIQEIPAPQAKADEVLIRVHATTVNRTDCALLTANLWVTRMITGLWGPKSPVPGTDFAGQIIAVGTNVKDFEVGDKVWGFDDTGLKSQAQYLCLHANRVMAMPLNIAYPIAVACVEGAHYAINCINKVNVKKGDKVLVNGATGAIGSAAVQLLVNLEVQVTAVCHSKDQQKVKAMGAERLIYYDQQDFTKDEDKFHYVLDVVGKSTFLKCIPLLLPNGVYISSELGPGAQNLFLALATPVSGKILGWHKGKQVKFPIPFDIKASLTLMKSLVEKGKFKPLIDKSYPLEEIAQAYEYVMSGQKVGNVIITYED